MYTAIASRTQRTEERKSPRMISPIGCASKKEAVPFCGAGAVERSRSVDICIGAYLLQTKGHRIGSGFGVAHPTKAEVSNQLRALRMRFPVTDNRAGRTMRAVLGP